MPNAVVLKGMKEFLTATDRASKQIKKDTRSVLREVAVPVARDAEQLAAVEIRRIGVKWSLMRVGVTRTLVYVAPKQKGARKDVSRRRPNLAPLLMDRAMSPALERNRDVIEKAVEHVIDHVGEDWGRGG